MSERKVSVVIPCHNSEKFIFEAISSVLRQTYNDIEIIVVDDGSSDDSWDVIKSFKEKKVKSIRQENKGGCNARNIGFSYAKGDYVMFLDSDDMIGPNVVESLVNTFKRGSDISACSWKRLVNENNSWLEKPSGLEKRPINNDFLYAWLSGWYIPPSALMWSREALEETGNWDESLAANQDGDLIMRALLSGKKINYSDKGVAYYRSHGVSKISVSNNVKSISALKSRIKVLKKISSKLAELGRLEKYKVVIGQAYHKLARNSFLVDLYLARSCVKESKILAGKKSIIGSMPHKMIVHMMGLENKEMLVGKTLSKFYVNKTRRKFNKLKKF
jgi:glycosyltransferase involved in cell wall biosynthesis